MAARKSRESARRYGWPSVIAIGVVVVAAGFTVGVVAGITWEEAPGNIDQHLPDVVGVGVVIHQTGREGRRHGPISAWYSWSERTEMGPLRRTSTAPTAAVAAAIVVK